MLMMVWSPWPLSPSSHPHRISEFVSLPFLSARHLNHALSAPLNEDGSGAEPKSPEHPVDLSNPMYILALANLDSSAMASSSSQRRSAGFLRYTSALRLFLEGSNLRL